MANLNIADLDFDDIKENLKTFLKSQEEFSDYDFEGSGLSVLLDVLAYNTHYNAYLANMLVNESFLDSAVKRSSAVSIAKHLGYVPTSRRGSKAIVNITVNNPVDNPTTLTLDRYTPFVTTVNGTAYTFLNTSPLTVTPDGGVYSFNNVQIVEGEQLEINYVCVQPGPDEKFVIPNENVDTSTLLVTVQNSATDLTTTIFTMNNDVTGIDSTSPVFFLEENQFEQYQIYFGDGVLGKKLSVGNIINIRYVVTSGPDVNTSNTVAQTFTTNSIGGSSNVIISTASNPTGGSLKESISSIKFNATKFNAARNRAVTVSDYETLVTSYNPDIESIAVWGGEDNDPPAYGKVFISLKPRVGFLISDSTKNNIKLFLKDKKILAIQPEFIDPVYYYLQLVFYIEFNSLVTTKSSSTIENVVRNAINNYFDEEVQKFNREFNKGKLTKIILESDPSIVSVVFEVKIQRRNALILNEENSFTQKESINFSAPIVPGSLKTSRFYIINNNIQTLVSFSDVPDTDIPDLNGTGTIQLIEVNTESVIKPSVGSINYSTGTLSLTPFIPTGLPNNINDFRVTASVQEPYQNIKVNRNEIIVLDETQLNAAAGRSAGLTVNVTAL